MNEVSGSHLIGSVARCVFVMESANDSETEDRVVWACAKNNDGELGARTAWYRRNGLFAPCNDFPWDEFEEGAKNTAGKITEVDMEKLFQNGFRTIARKLAVDELAMQTSASKSTCYNALQETGRFAEHIQKGSDGLLTWNPKQKELV